MKTISKDTSKRVCDHMNNEHIDSVHKYLIHYGKITSFNNAYMEEINNRYIKINYDDQSVIINFKDEISEEEILELAIEAGADDCITKVDIHEIQCSVNEIYNVKKNLEKRVSNFISTEIEWLPLNSVKVSSEQQDKIIEFFETLEDDDDVQNIFSNMEIKAN